jgi:hypothetical protein
MRVSWELAPRGPGRSGKCTREASQVTNPCTLRSVWCLVKVPRYTSQTSRATAGPEPATGGKPPSSDAPPNPARANSQVKPHSFVGSKDTSIAGRLPPTTNHFM